MSKYNNLFTIEAVNGCENLIKNNSNIIKINAYKYQICMIIDQ